MVITLWSLRYVFLVRGQTGEVNDLLPLILQTAWRNPREFVGGFLMAGLVPNLIALTKNLAVLASWSTLFSFNEAGYYLPPASYPLPLQTNLQPIESSNVKLPGPKPPEVLKAPTKSFSIMNVGLSTLSVSSNVATLIVFYKTPPPWT